MHKLAITVVGFLMGFFLTSFFLGVFLDDKIHLE